LGKAGVKRYSDLLAFLGDADPDVVLHAIAGFANDTSQPVINELIRELIAGDTRKAPAASEALRLIGSDLALNSVITSTRTHNSKWLLATLGRFPAGKVRQALVGDPLFDRVAPVLLLSSSSNWIAEDAVDTDLKFLLKQNL
jgi:hypothetical protein